VIGVVTFTPSILTKLGPPGLETTVIVTVLELPNRKIGAMAKTATISKMSATARRINRELNL